TVEKGGQISVNSSGAGQGGNLEVTAKEAVTVTGWWPIRDSSLTANARSLGAGGNIEISAPLIVIRDKGGTIQAGSDDAGEAGQIYLRNVDDALQVLDASILTSTEGADGGNIEISGSGYLYINNGEISTSVRARDGNGGNIRLKPGFIVLDKGKIKADASKGNGGDVMINATGIYKFSKEPLTGGADEKNAAISAHSELGINGEIRINSPDTDISGDLIVPPADFLKKEDVSIQQCEQRSVRESSRFAIGPLKDLPVPPDDLNAVEP
ncbi:MAG: hypothetical protein GY862_33265, partial [Gammaproteobacteria bacterium]|nr:hypothetical protein [Gammaproteobacteria bacterium]